MELKVGDKILVTTAFSRYIVEIERVTKTQAITKPINTADYRLKFKKEYQSDPVMISKDRWSTTTYKVLT